MSTPQETMREGWSYCGEVWTDARGHAVVVLPSFARAHRAGFQYELAPIDAECTATVVEEIEADRFAVATDEPHVKVAWRVTPLRADDNPAGSDPTSGSQAGDEESQR